MRFCVVGAGAVGGWIAAKLALAGEQVSVLARGETLSRIEADGLLLTQAGETRSAALNAAADAQSLGPQDLLVIAVKAPALPGLTPKIADLIGPDTLIVPMLNGVPWWFAGDPPLQSVDPDGRIAEALPAERLVGCVVHAACSRDAPNHVRVAYVDKLILGLPEGGTGERVGRLAALFERAGIPVEQSADVRRAVWYKLWGNATINPLSALTRATADKLLADAPIRAFMLEAMAELARIGSAIGCPIAESGEDRMQVTARLGAFKPSMLQDVEAGRPIELEALVGAPREIARRHRLATPALDRIYAMTRLMADSLGLL